MRFCKNCFYCKFNNDMPLRSDCTHPKAIVATEEYMVTGELPARKLYSCTAMRAGICGGEAILYEVRDAS